MVIPRSRSYSRTALWLTLVFGNFVGRIAASNIDVSLKASWSGAPFLLELLESAAQEQPESYFPILDCVAAGDFEHAKTDEKIYKQFIKTARNVGFLTAPEVESSFNLSVSVRAASPVIEAHYNYYRDTLVPNMGSGYKDDCPVWLYWNGKQSCGTDLEHVLSKAPSESERTQKQVAFDRILEKDASPVPAAVLYADITSKIFKEFHAPLALLAKKGKISYRLRYRPTAGHKEEDVILSGYGVELVLKKTDYIVMDDRKVVDSKTEKDEKAAPPPSAKDVEDETEVDDIVPLHPEDLYSLGMKAASYIMKSEDPFSMLNKVTRDFPKYSAALAKTEIDADFEKEHIWNKQRSLMAGANEVWINGQSIQASEMNIYALMDHLRRERQIIQNIKELGFSSNEAISLISHKALTEAKSDDEPQRFDWRDAEEGNQAIVWLNNLEKDKRYEEWPESEQAMMRQIYPGQIHAIRKNIHHLVVPVDLSNVDDLNIILEQLSIYVSRKVAIRIGVVPILKNEIGRNLAKLLYHLIEIYGLKTSLTFFAEIAGSTPIKLPSADTFSKAIDAVKVRGEREILTRDQVLENDDRLKPVIAYGKRLDINASPPPVFINGYVVPREDNWIQSMSQVIPVDVREAQRLVITGTGPFDFVQHLLRNPAKKRNSFVIPDDQDSVELVGIASMMKKYPNVVKDLPYATGKRDEEAETSAVDMWIVGDFDSQHGYDLLKSAVVAQSATSNVNIVAVNNPEQMPKSSMLSSLLYHLRGSGLFNAPGILEKILGEKAPEKDFVDLPQIESVPEDLQHIVKAEGWANPDMMAARKFWESCGAMLNELKFKPGERGIIINGRVVGPLPRDVDFEKDDYEQLINFELQKRIRPALTTVKDIGKLDLLKEPHGAAKLTSLISLSGKSDRPQGIFGSAPSSRVSTYKEWESKHTAIEVGDESDAVYQIVALVDPASEKAQKWVAILRALSKLKGVHLKVYLNPEQELGELPVKRFYRYVLNPVPKFDADGKLSRPRAIFKGTPQNILVTLGMDIPPSWLVAPKDCIHDLDNIKLSAFKSRFGHADVTAVYELRNILIEGHSRDMSSGGQPPAGTQLILGSKKHPHAVDTLVMANLGYFQFKAKPGFWNMELMPGKSKKIFTIESAGSKGYFAQPGDESPEITLMSLKGITLYPRLRRNAGMEDADILEADDDEEDDSAIGKAKKYTDGLFAKMGILKGKEGKGVATTHQQQADINIFSVASGHLYERFLSIMILSVMKNTNNTVKFWFIENFLSPSFKNFIPVMSEEYGFQYELVTYKWPHWLRAQKEKQREIWGYKILFLDVLFPLDLDKVIFVDADQIVRTDLKELVDLELHGAPYGFTPMCDSRTEIEGFRFWKTGYWASFLRGKPYHISALYVVDLRRFRGLAAGDRLRQQYHQLSADPNSLANLDQDLPNHMQMLNLPIFSLPQDWLWCETWCSDESLKTAKTIDLCNNPMTKEPKLDRARRQVPEWNAYDEEVAKLAERERKSGGEGVGYMREAVVQKEALGEQEKGKAKEEEPEDKAKESKRVKDEL